MAGALKFKKMLTAINKGDWEAAALEMEHSRWYVEVPNRHDDVDMVRNG